jgi:hypothetical protein
VMHVQSIKLSYKLVFLRGKLCRNYFSVAISFVQGYGVSLSGLVTGYPVMWSFSSSS